jgi:hypothetical protein
MTLRQSIRSAKAAIREFIHVHSRAMLEYARVRRRVGRMDWGKAPRVSVVVPLYNDATHVIEALESVRDQSWTVVDCIIVDDGSTDQGPELVAEWIAREPRFRMIRHEANRGLAAARNTGMAAADGTYVCFLDSDDALCPHSIARRVLAFEAWAEDEAVLGVFGRILPVYETIKRIDRIGAVVLGQYPWAANFISTQGRCPFPCHAPLLRLAPLRRLGGFDESLRHGGEDWDFWQRAMRRGYRFQGCRGSVGYYRQKQGSMVRRMSSAHFATAAELLGRAYAAVSIDEMEAWPGRFDQPLPHYEFNIRLAPRALRFAAMAEAAGDAEGRDAILAFFEPGSGAYLRAAIDVKGGIRSGVNRAFCRPEDAPIRPGTQEDRIYGRVLDAFTARAG